VSFIRAINPLAYHALAYAISAIVQKGIGFLLFLWLAHSLSVREYATFGLLFALQAGVAALAPAGVIEVVIGRLPDQKSKETLAELFGSANAVVTVLSLICIILVAAGSGLIATIVGSSTFVIIITAIGGVFAAFYTVQSQLTRLEENHRASLIISFFPQIFGLVSGAVAFLYFHSLAVFFTGYTTALILSLPIFILMEIGFYGFIRHPRDTLQIFVLIGPFVLIAVFGWLSGYGNTYLVQSFFTPTDVARFTFAYTLSSIMQLVATSLNQVWSPRVFKMIFEFPLKVVERKNRQFYKIQGIALGIVGAVVLGVFPVVIQLGGEKLAAYRSLTIELFFLFAAYAISIPWYHVQNYYYAHSKGKELMNVTLITSALGTLAWLIAMWALGPIGAFVGFMLLMASRMLGALFWARREWALDIAWEGPLIAVVLLLSGLGVARFITN
jgi:O-antigen/teichoic acid export membrane protein